MYILKYKIFITFSLIGRTQLRSATFTFTHSKPNIGLDLYTYNSVHEHITQDHAFVFKVCLPPYIAI